MSNFRTKLLGFAAVATAFAGISYGQTISCVVGGGANPSLRAEGETELLADLVATCSNTGAATSGALYITVSAPVTSKAVTIANLPSNEVSLIITPNGGPAQAAIQGTVTGSQIAFTIPNNATNSLPATAASPFTIRVANVRVNASAATNPQVTETGVLSYANGPGTSANASVLTATGAYNAGFVLQTLGATALLPFGTTNYTTCVGNPGSILAAPGTSFTVQIKELVGGAFHTLANEGGSAPGASGVGTATTATEIQLTLGNIPSAATVYVPQAIPVGGTTLSIANSTTVSTGPLAALNVVGFTPSSGTVTVVYTVTADAAVGAQTFNVPVIVAFAANSSPAQTSPMNVLVSYAPTGAVTGPATSVPTFAASTATPVNASSLTACSTTLLFPYVTNASGFETGIAIANTTTDNLGTIPGKPSAASPVNGTCTLNFYGNAAQPTATTTPTIGAYSSSTPAVVPVYANILTSLVGSSGFTGYAIAQCNFQMAHGFAFITDTAGNFSGTEGYLATVIPAGRGENTAQTLSLSISTTGLTFNTVTGVASGTISGTATGATAVTGQ